MAHWWCVLCHVVAVASLPMDGWRGLRHPVVAWPSQQNVLLLPYELS